MGPDTATDEDPWSTDIMQMGVDLCARFDAAAGRTEHATADTDRPAGLPVRLHKNANIEAEYHALWPDEATARLPGVDVAPLELHYVRIQEEQRTRLLPAHYRRQVRGLIEVADGDGVWLNGFERLRDQGTERAVDIRISGIEPGGRAGNSGPMTIEILTIEIPDPRPRPETAPQPTPG